MIYPKILEMINFRATGILVLLFTFSLTQAQDPVEMEVPEGWSVIFAPYMHFSSLNGESAIGLAGPTEVNADFGDLLKVLQTGIMFRTEVHKDKWGLLLDFIYISLSDDIATPVNTLASIKVEQFIIESMISRRYEVKNGSLDLFLGTRYWDVEAILGISGGAFNAEQMNGSNWLDPVIGARIQKELSEKWFGGVRLDFGGFGLSSDFSWNTQLSLGYNISNTISLVGQYKYLSVNYDNGNSGRERFSYDVNVSGPLIGLALHF